MPASPKPTQEINAFERMSAPYLLRLHSAPRWLLAVALAAFLVVGLLVEGPIGATLLFVLALFLGWLAAIGWRLLSPGARAIRLLIVALVVAAGVAQLL
jgi:energy-coupling factor transporter transmembrane protein EcfT